MWIIRKCSLCLNKYWRWVFKMKEEIWNECGWQTKMRLILVDTIFLCLVIYGISLLYKSIILRQMVECDCCGRVFF